MSDEQAIEAWGRQEGEPMRWFQRFDKFRLMVPVRSIAAVFNEENQRKPEKTRGNPGREWYEAAKQWQWEKRAAAWDAYRNAQIEAEILAEEKHILRTHYALRHKRIAELDAIATKLIDYLEDENNIWLPDVKGVGTGPTAERVDLIRFNAELFAQIRGVLADIAAEKGERVKKTETTFKELPKVYINMPDDDGLPDEQPPHAGAAKSGESGDDLV